MHRLDLIVEDQIIVELKAVKALDDIHFAQVKSYLKAARLGVGLLLNFNAPKLIVKRIVLTDRQIEPSISPTAPLKTDAPDPA